MHACTLPVVNGVVVSLDPVVLTASVVIMVNSVVDVTDDDVVLVG